MLHFYSYSAGYNLQQMAVPNFAVVFFLKNNKYGKIFRLLPSVQINTLRLN